MPKTLHDHIDDLAGVNKPKAVSVWQSQKFDGSIDWGAKYDDGTSRKLFNLTIRGFESEGELHDAVEAGFARFGIDITQMPDWRGSKKGRRPNINERIQFSDDWMSKQQTFDRFYFSGGFHRMFSEAADFTSFAARDFGRWQDKATPPDPERVKALARCRSLKTLAEHSTANPGEAANARAALDRLKERHSIKDSEI